MDTFSLSSRPSEHWMTIMTCILCKKSPDTSPIFKCNLGHTVCGNCFEKLCVNGAPRCKECNSSTFKPRKVSNDFLQKLKRKPGIGRPRRYQLPMITSESGDSEMDMMRDDTITLEKIFQLSSNQVKDLFESTAREKMEAKQKMRRAKSPHSSSNCNSDIFCITKFESGDLEDIVGDSDVVSYAHQKCTSSSSCMLSKKPIYCPHGPCGKVVTISSFLQHFKHDHADVPVFTSERSKELHLIHDVRVIEFNTTYCMAMIKVYEVLKEIKVSCQKIAPLSEKFNQKVPVGTFWLMVTGSGKEKKSKSYGLYWLMTSSDERFTCTLEMSSAEENISVSTFCAVNDVIDCRVTNEATNGLNCLFLCYDSLHNLLEEGPKLHLRVSIH